jgi:hypothetical protein
MLSWQPLRNDQMNLPLFLYAASNACRSFVVCTDSAWTQSTIICHLVSIYRRRTRKPLHLRAGGSVPLTDFRSHAYTLRTAQAGDANSTVDDLEALKHHLDYLNIRQQRVGFPRIRSSRNSAPCVSFLSDVTRPAGPRLLHDYPDSSPQPTSSAVSIPLRATAVVYKTHQIKPLSLLPVSKPVDRRPSPYPSPLIHRRNKRSPAMPLEKYQYVSNVWRDGIFDNKVVFCTGGAGSICSAQVRALVHLGANACIIGRNVEKTENMAKDIATARKGAKVIGIGAVDVRKPEALQAAAERCARELGSIDFVM